MVLKAVDDRAVPLETFLELSQPLFDAAPTGRDEVNEETEVVDTRMPLGEEVALDPLEATDDLVHEAPHLGEMAGARPEVLAQPVLDRLGEPGLELRRRRGKRLDGAPRPLECSFDRRGIGTAGRRLVQPLLRPLDGVEIHRHDDTTLCGWMSRTSTTSCRRS